MDLAFWNVKGYNGIQITKESLHNKKYSFDDIKKYNSNITQEIEENLEKGGIVFGLSKKKNIKAIYIFKLTKKGKDKTLVFDKKIILEEVNKCIEEYENDIDKVLKHIIITRHDIDNAYWREKEISKKEKFTEFVRGFNLLVWIFLILTCFVSTTLIVRSTLNSLNVSNSSIEEIKNDELLMDYVSYINNYDYIETTSVFSNIEDKTELVVIEIILPTIIMLFGNVLLIISLKELLDLTKNVTDNQTLFTSDKYQLFKKFILNTIIALFLILKNLIIWLLIVTLFEIIEYVFNYCVYLTNNKKS